MAISSPQPSHNLVDSLSERGSARRRILDTAERLFMTRGYSAVALRDLAQALGMRQASLYYHFPGGKDEVYVTVAKEAFARHGAGVRAALETPGPIESRLQAVADWFGTQPSMCLMGMVHADLPALEPSSADLVRDAAGFGLFEPLRAAFARARAEGEIGPHDPNMLAGAFLTLLDGATISQSIPHAGERSRVARAMIALFLNGARAS